MLKRAFRRGIRLGVLVGIIFVVVKIVQSRRASTATSAGDGWTGSREAWTPPAAETWSSTTPDPAPVEAAPVEAAAVEAAPREAAPVDETPVEAAPPAPAPRSTAPPKATTRTTRTTTRMATPDDEPAKTVALNRTTARSTVRPSAKATSAGKATRTTKNVKVTWVEPNGSTCPPSHPVKAKLTSRIFHLPGMFAYERTRPDRCYSDESAAEGDGFTRARR